jgi:hypothetical protein
MSRISGNVVSNLALANVLAGCAGPEAAITTESASRSTVPEAISDLECRQQESAVYDYGDDAVGSSTPEEALAAFTVESEGGWLDQLSRSESIQRDPGVAAVFRDAGGRPAGLVYLERRERGWLVVGWDRCV